MSWLARLDARAAKWPAAARWPYRSLKWFLVLIGIYLACAMAFTEYRDGRLGLGLGIVVASLLALIKGVVMAFNAPAGPSHPHRID